MSAIVHPLGRPVAERPLAAVREPRDERSLVQAGERAREHADGHALEYAAARGRNRPERALDRAHRFTDPSPGTNGGLRWKGTLFSQRRSACQWISAVTCMGMSG